MTMAGMIQNIIKRTRDLAVMERVDLRYEMVSLDFG